jgi:hypothetical protein
MAPNGAAGPASAAGSNLGGPPARRAHAQGSPDQRSSTCDAARVRMLAGCWFLALSQPTASGTSARASGLT